MVDSRDDKHGRRKRSKSRERRRRSYSRSRSRSRERRRGESGRDHKRSPSPREPSPDLTPIERDARTVFAWQLSARIRQSDLEKFFSKVGKIRCVKLIMDNKTRRSKGIAYIEFREVESAQMALSLTGTRLLGVPIQVQISQAEKSRACMTARAPVSGPLKLYVGSLHFNINEDMLKSIFEPFGTIEDAKIVRDSSTSRSQGYGYIYFVNAEEGKKALEQLDGFEVAGKSLKVNYVTDRSDLSSGNGSQTLDNDETDRTGVGLGPTGRLALMAKLAEGTGLIMPKSALNTLNAINNSANPSVSSAVSAAAAASASYAPPTCTQCFVLSNMFDPKTTPADVLEEIREDVLEECCKLEI